MEVEDGTTICSGCSVSLTTLERPGPNGGLAPVAGRPTGLPPEAARHRSRLEEARFLPGEILADRYRVVGPLGRGGMGEVYRAEDLKLAETVALKFLPEAVEKDPRRLERLINEAKLARQVSHPNVCRVHDVQEVNGLHFISMEYVEGEDLGSLLRRIGRLPKAKAIEIGLELCRGLDAVHQRRILHHDLKPANVLIDGAGRVRLADFGVAGFAGALARGGTAVYMAPELRLGQETSIRSDVYALGLVLYEVFTGSRALIDTETPIQQPSLLVPGIDPYVEGVIMNCLETDRGKRPASARAVATALAKVDSSTFQSDSETVEGLVLRALLLSELIDSSQWVEEVGDIASADFFRQHDRLARDLLKTHRGREIDRTDGFLLLFARPIEAVLYALDYHHRVRQLAQKHGCALETRVAIHFAEIVLRENAPPDVQQGAKPLEVVGLARSVATQLMRLAGNRQTLLTQSAFDMARRAAVGVESVAGSMRWLAHGEYIFRAVNEPVGVFEVGREGFAPLVPPAESDEMRRLDAGDAVLGWRPAAGQQVPRRAHWELSSKLGEGGFGEVWLGSHMKTHERRVFKFCYETEHLRSLQREITVFRLLKEELGERNDIARLLDWNLEEAPYFIESAYTEGGSLVAWSTARGGIDRVDLEERLEFVAQTATALEAAHSVGVLHKDVKPTNVLITRGVEGRWQAILGDFGIGQITDRDRLQARGITVLGLTEGLTDSGSATSGTQLYMAPELLTGHSPTIQSDIYALGVMLYQVVVGDLERPLAQGWKREVEDELLRQDIAECVDGERRKRPGSALEVAERLRTLPQRHAARESERQRWEAVKRGQRRRKLFASVSIVSTAVLLVVSIFAFLAVRARDDAERRQEQAEGMIDFMMGDLHEGLEKIGRLDLLEQVARSSQLYFDSLTERDESILAAHKRGVTQLNISHVLLDQGDSGAARASAQAAFQLFEAFAERHPDHVEFRQGMNLSRLALGQVLLHQGDTKAALVALRAAVEDSEQLLDLEPGNHDRQFAVAEGRYLIANAESEIGHLNTALVSAQTALELAKHLTAEAQVPWRGWRLLLESHTLLGKLFHGQDDLSAAFGEFDAARRVAERLRAEDPANPIWSRNLAWLHSKIGHLFYLQEDSARALESFETSAAAYRELIAADPDRVQLRSRLAEGLRWLGKLQVEAVKPGAAMDHYEEAIALLENLVAGDPTRLDWLPQLAVVHQSIGFAHLKFEDTRAALAAFQAAHGFRQQVASETGDPGPQYALSWNHLQLGDIHSRRQEGEQAQREWSLALGLLWPIVTGSSVHVRSTHAIVLIRLGRLEEARPFVEELLEQGWDESQFLRTVKRSSLGRLLIQ